MATKDPYPTGFGVDEGGSIYSLDPAHISFDAAPPGWWQAKAAELEAERDRYRFELEHARALLEGSPETHRALGEWCGERPCGICLALGRIEQALASDKKEVTDG